MKLIEPPPTDETPEWDEPSEASDEPREREHLRSTAALPTLLGPVDLVARADQEHPDAANDAPGAGTIRVTQPEI